LLLVVLTGCETAAGPAAPVAPAVAPERVAIGPDADKIDARTIVGKPMPPWHLDWMGAAPADVRGQVVLVRWFTEGCPYCTATAPSLVALHDELGTRGLRVIGVYHHKSEGAPDPKQVRALADEFHFKFPVAIDHDWKTLDAWWLVEHPGWTSISFLIDKRGTVRFVHTGGQYEPGSADAAQMRRWIDQLLAE
jgi:peroxiredoxin